MKLNHDCVRDVLLYLEEKLTDKPLKIKDIASHFENDYSLDDIVYTFQKLEEAKYVSTSAENTCSKHSLVKTITWKGHNFLDNIRDAKILAKAKQSLSELKSFSLEVLADICKELIKAFAFKKF